MLFIQILNLLVLLSTFLCIISNLPSSFYQLLIQKQTGLNRLLTNIELTLIQLQIKITCHFYGTSLLLANAIL